MSALRNIGVWCAAAAATAVLLGYALPWAGRNGYAGDVVRLNLEHRRDATPLFYSESDRVWSILRGIAAQRAGAP